MSCICLKKVIIGFWQILAKKIAKRGSICCYEKYKIKLEIEEVKQFCCIYDNEKLFWYLYDQKKYIFSLCSNYDDHYMKLCSKYDSSAIFETFLIVPKFNIVELFDIILDNNAINCLSIFTKHILLSNQYNFTEFRSKYYKFSKYVNFYEKMRLFNILRTRDLTKNDLSGIIIDISDLLIIAVKKKRLASIELLFHKMTTKNKEYVLNYAIKYGVNELIEKCLN